MITFRYHVVTILAVFLALAVGVALGGGPLSELGRGSDRDLEQRADQLEARLAADAATRELDQQVMEGLGAASIAGKLADRAITIVTMPGADPEVAEALGAAVERAGGAVRARVSVKPALVDPDEASLVDSLGAQLVQSLPASGVPASATTYDRMGALIARTVAVDRDGGAPLDTTAEEILSSLESANLLSAEQREQGGSVVIVLLGEEPEDPQAIDNIYAGLLRGLAETPDAVLVAGDTTSAEEGLLGLLREDTSLATQVATVDSVQSPAGQLVAVLGAASAAGGKPGHWGALGNDGALPRG